jgi:hypothetical protein
MRPRKVLFRLVDLIWPTLEPLGEQRMMAPLRWLPIRRNSPEVIEAAFEILTAELKNQDEHIRRIESKLLGISSLAPLAATVLVALVGFLVSGRLQQVTEGTGLTVVIGACYVVLQMLRALSAAINGLRRRGFQVLSLEDVRPKPDQEKNDYLVLLCEELCATITNNREAINVKVDQLELGHTSLKNAVAGLLITMVTVLSITIVETKAYWVGTVILLVSILALIAVIAQRAYQGSKSEVGTGIARPEPTDNRR